MAKAYAEVTAEMEAEKAAAAMPMLPPGRALGNRLLVATPVKNYAVA